MAVRLHLISVRLLSIAVLLQLMNVRLLLLLLLPVCVMPILVLVIALSSPSSPLQRVVVVDVTENEQQQGLISQLCLV